MILTTASTKNYLILVSDSLDDILDLCEEKKKEGWEIVSVFPLPQLELGSFFKLTQITTRLFLLFRKKEEETTPES